MPFVANTPESLIDRSDSKNPNTTCRGLTSSGRPCRRPLTAAQTLSNSLSPRRHQAVPDPRDERLYCWQHKEQASYSAHSSPGPRASATPILEVNERTSLDTLADRLGLIALQEKEGKRRKPKDGRSNSEKTGSRPAGQARPKHQSKPKQTGSLTFCFCFSMPINEVTPVARPSRPEPRPIQKADSSIPLPGSVSRKPRHSQVDNLSSPARLNASTASPGKSSYRSRKSTASHTAQLKDLIPDTLDAPTASALMTELARPYVETEEPGFIYMFWLTPSSITTPPPVDAARALLTNPTALSPGGSQARTSRRASDAVSAFAGATSTGPRKTMLLKIGRAANVQRRMNQWQRQCGQNIEMLRYYPYHPTASASAGGGERSGVSSSSSVLPRMTPHCKRVERLVHLELAGLGYAATRDVCTACGREHREWFEVEATRLEIGRVDAVIRRWVDWDEGQV